MTLRVLDLFSGIGGFSLGLERTGGFKTVAFCEIEPFPRRVLAKHWPEVPCYDDVRTLNAARLASDGITHIDVITGGFPCQDLSVAGKRAGIAGERSGLWAEICRLAGELRPRFVLVENVSNLLAGERGAWFGRVLSDLAALGYDAEWHCIPATHVGAPHQRDRVWVISYSPEANVSGDLLGPRDLWRASTQHRGLCGDLGGRNTGQWQVEPQPRMVRVADGLSRSVDSRLEALGNTVVPQIPELIGRAILASLEEAA